MHLLAACIILGLFACHQSYRFYRPFVEAYGESPLLLGPFALQTVTLALFLLELQKTGMSMETGILAAIALAIALWAWQLSENHVKSLEAGKGEPSDAALCQVFLPFGILFLPFILLFLLHDRRKRNA